MVDLIPWENFIEKHGFPIVACFALGSFLVWFLKVYLKEKREDKLLNHKNLTEYKNTITHIVNTLQMDSARREEAMREAIAEAAQHHNQERGQWMSTHDKWIAAIDRIEINHTAHHEKISQGIHEVLAIVKKENGATKRPRH